MSEAARHLRRLVVALERGQRVPGDVADWLRCGVRRYLDGRGAWDLETALGLRGPGVRTVWTHIATENRNAALRLAFDHCALPGKRDSSWSRCRILSDAIQRFERRIWPSVCQRREPPSSLSGLERCIFGVFTSGAAVPRSARALYELLK